ncbi:MAG: 23S rRNA (pseudouridine(1915)-N(3))-methyltransferase RlmH [Rhodobacteraceae bacterium]|nr:23S rRNA (pseudouridine(1915)-N(3))-methyltransferase RlmH [Paracoccaceae bacterium]MCY4197780.1 23S rRNA (pseudouridine(1915)-N(3))-methyltransferase RlmH [Paracoccaceae bacterium]
MRLILCAAGKLRHGHERELTAHYLDRIRRSGKNIGFGAATLQEYDPNRRPFPAWLRQLAEDSNTVFCVLDESARQMTSTEFANALAGWRDRGMSTASFMIGGPDGVSGEFTKMADHRISFGRMTFPHMLMRILLTEQLFRAVSILRGDPYHRE